mgnify:CR=1 FL=1
MKMITENDVIRLLPISRAIEVVEQAFIHYTQGMITIGKREIVANPQELGNYSRIFQNIVAAHLS